MNLSKSNLRKHNDWLRQIHWFKFKYYLGMKKFFVMADVSLSLLLGILLTGCTNEGDPDLNKFRLRSEADSIVCCEIFKSDPNFVTIMRNRYGRFDFKDVTTWPVKWEKMEGWNQYRVTQLILDGSDQFPAPIEVPEKIADLEMLEALRVSGVAYSGAFPEAVAAIEGLKYIYIVDTSIESLPENIFNENRLNCTITYNQKLTHLPSSVKYLKSHQNDADGYPMSVIFNLNNNGFEGKCPNITEAHIDLSSNKFTSLEWEGAGGTWYSGGIWYGAYLDWNNLSGEIPEYILNDPKKLASLRYQTGVQRPGYGFSNRPAGWDDSGVTYPNKPKK